jgi:hypothetical protein
MNASKTLCIAFSAVLASGCVSQPVYVPVVSQAPTATKTVPAPRLDGGVFFVTSDNCIVAHEQMNYMHREIIKHGEKCLNSRGGFNLEKQSCKNVLGAILALRETNLHKMAGACVDEKYFLGVAMPPGDYIKLIDRSNAVVKRVNAGIESLK